MPFSDLDLRSKCLNKVTSKTEEPDEVEIRDVDRLITAIYQKEYEFSKAFEGSKNKLLSYHSTLLDSAFLRLIDDITGYLTFKRYKVL